jgi:hypothetical protein
MFGKDREPVVAPPGQAPHADGDAEAAEAEEAQANPDQVHLPVDEEPFVEVVWHVVELSSLPSLFLF